MSVGPEVTRRLQTMPYSCIVHRPDPAIAYFEAYKNIGRKYTRISSGTDAGTVIQSAINALTSGGKIFFKNAVYMIGTEIDVNNPVILEGEGAITDADTVDGTVIFKASTSLTNLLDVNPGADMLFGIRNIFIDGDNKVTNGINVTNVVHGNFESLRISECTYGLKLLYVQKSSFTNLRLLLNDYDLYIYYSGAIRPHELTFIRCYFGDANEYGIYTNFDAVYSIIANFFGCTIESNKKWGAFFNNVLKLGFYGCHWESNNLGNSSNIDDLSFSGSKNIVICGCDFTSTLVRYNLYVSASHVKVSANEFGGNVYLAVMPRSTAEANVFGGTLQIDDVQHSVFSANRMAGIVTIGVNTYYCSFDSNYVVSTINVIGTPNKFRMNQGYLTENSGTATFNGTGAQTAFAINHGLAATPKMAVVTAGSSDAGGDFYVTYDGSSITVTYATAPPAGTGNVVLRWYAEV